MADSPTPGSTSQGSRSLPPSSGVLEGVRVVPTDYGMPGSKGMKSPLRPLVWLLVPFVFCVVYGLMTR